MASDAQREPLRLGDAVSDYVTGFAGVITAMSQSLDGVDRFYVERQVNVAGEPAAPCGQWLGAARLTSISCGELERSAEDLPATIDQLQALLDETICTCTLAKRCPKHSPKRPTIGRD